ncbi:hypothetical protein ABW20_dc0101417 [Dactylellina cionopaga]|nr:hypothetical protein ABW20_dc0101417 [Dactylellina cionopaga]
MATPSSASIGELPIELHEQIISYLPWRDRVNCEHVCKVWREVIRSRFYATRYSIAPWLPVQDYDFDFYAPLQIHSLLVDGKSFSFKCHKGHKLFQVGYIVNDALLHELGEEVAKDSLGVVQCISSLNVIEKAGQGAEAVSVTKPIANLSVLSDMVVLPAWISEDEILKLYCRFTRQVIESEATSSQGAEAEAGADDGNKENDVSDDNNDDDDDNDDNDDEDEEDDDGSSTPTATNQSTTQISQTAPAPPRPALIDVSDGNFTSEVYKDTEEDYFRLTLGDLLMSIRRNLIADFVGEPVTDYSNAGSSSGSASGTTDSQEDIKIKARKRYEAENSTVVVKDLHFVKSGQTQALSIVFKGLLMPEKSDEDKDEPVLARSSP